MATDTPTAEAGQADADGSEPRESPQQRGRCACPSWTTRKECIRIRYPQHYGVGSDEPWMTDGTEDECECLCHDEGMDDDDY